MKVKSRKILLNESGNFLTRQKGCFVVKNIRTRKEVQKFPILEREIGEIQLVTGNLVSTGALVTACFNHIPVIIKTNLGSPVGILSSIDSLSHVETRCFQWQCVKDIKGMDICGEIVLAKMKGQNEVLRKYGLKRIDFSVFQKVKEIEDGILTDEELDNYIKNGVFPLDAIDKLRLKLMNIEGKVSQYYFKQIFTLFPETFRPENRRGYLAYDCLNNTLNLAYRILYSKCLCSLISAKLEPFLGFYHVTKFGQPSLVLDFMELYRFLIDDFVINYARKLNAEDFELKDVAVMGKKGKRAFLNKERNKEFLIKLEDYFGRTVNIPRIMRGKRCKLETMINEEALLLASFIRCERKSWTPRIASLD